MASCLALVVLGACAPAKAPGHGAAPGHSAGEGPTTIPRTTTTPRSQEGPEHLSGGAAATRTLDPERRAVLGLPPVSGAAAVSQLPALSAAQWASPEAVGGRFVVVDTNFAAAEDPARLWARRTAYATPRFAEDLATSSSGGAGLAELAAQGASFRGEVIGLAAVGGDETTAVVGCSVRRFTDIPGATPSRARVAFYRLTLVREHTTGRWLVADVQLS